MLQVIVEWASSLWDGSHYYCRERL